MASSSKSSSRNMTSPLAKEFPSASSQPAVLKVGNAVATTSTKSDDSDEEQEEDDSEEDTESERSPSGTSTPATSDDDEDDDDEDNTDALLLKAIESAKAKEKAVAEEAAKFKAGEGEKDEFDEDVLFLDEEKGEKRVKERPIPGLSIPRLPSHPLPLHLLIPRTSKKATSTALSQPIASTSTSTINEKRQQRRDQGRIGAENEGANGLSNGLGGMLGNAGKAHGHVGGASGGGRDKGKGKEKGGVGLEPELDTGEYEKQLTRREKAKLPRKQSSTDEWASLPTIPTSLLPQMKRDYQALNLGNSLDPKRFMKGGKGVGNKVPEVFGIGTLITPPRHLQSSTLSREKAYVPGSIVQALVGDQELGGYAKRKFGELQDKKMANGRGRGWKKRRVG